MKVLVTSLLRLGDLLMAAPALELLKRRYPGCQLHVVINPESKPIGALIPAVDKYHVFNRNELQGQLASPQSPLIKPVDDLLRWVDELNSERFDLVVNLTHNHLSGRLCALLQAPHKIGLVLEA